MTGAPYRTCARQRHIGDRVVSRRLKPCPIRFAGQFHWSIQNERRRCLLPPPALRMLPPQGRRSLRTCRRHPRRSFSRSLEPLGGALTKLIAKPSVARRASLVPFTGPETSSRLRNPGMCLFEGFWDDGHVRVAPRPSASRVSLGPSLAAPS